MKNILNLGKALTRSEQQKINGGRQGIVRCDSIRDCFFLGEIGDYFCVELNPLLDNFKQCVRF